MIHIYCGEGKGKTTAAAGLAVRAAGSGKQVLVVQFLKGRPSGEVGALQSMPGITLLRGEGLLKFTWEMSDEEKLRVRQEYETLLETAVKHACSGACDMLVLDESVGACSAAVLDEDTLLAFLREKPKALEVVLTGRSPSERMLELADYVTDMHKVKHPYDQGVLARKGVEY